VGVGDIRTLSSFASFSFRDRVDLHGHSRIDADFFWVCLHSHMGTQLSLEASMRTSLDGTLLLFDLPMACTHRYVFKKYAGRNAVQFLDLRDQIPGNRGEMAEVIELPLLRIRECLLPSVAGLRQRTEEIPSFAPNKAALNVTQ
jgi:hypothetical protein